MTKQRLKKDIDVSLKKKYLTYDQNFLCTDEDYLHENHIQDSRHSTNFYMIYSPNKFSDRQTLKCRMTTVLTTVPSGKQNLSIEKKYENRNICSKIIIEHLF